TPEEGYAFTDDFAATINGQPAHVEHEEDGDVTLTYAFPKTTPPGTIAGTVSLLNDVGVSGAHINLALETITLPSGFSGAAWSIDGGKKWKKGALPTGAALAKLFDKGMTLWVASRWNDKDVKDGKKVVEKKGVAASAQIVQFPKIDKRPKANTEKLKPWYGETEWAPMKGASLPSLAYEWAASSDGKTPAGAWAALDVSLANEGADLAGGFTIKAAGTKETYLFRTKAEAEGEKYTPAGKAFRVKPKALAKPPKVKANEKKGVLVIKKGLLCEAGTGAAAVVHGPGTLNIVSALTAGETNQVLEKTTVLIWKAATGKAPPSEKQSLTLPAAPPPPAASAAP
ncbi:MAG: hypothetical protein FWG72_10690, partial [Oscillospiraceae bacterium]|nr:hypothetical protein [Oscillospiraceae bacterium]